MRTDASAHERPLPWPDYRQDLRHAWTIPFHRFEWCTRHVAWALSRWSLVQIMEYLGHLSLLIAVIFYVHDAPERRKIKLYQAWQVINTSQGKEGSGGRVEALQELNEERVALIGVDASGAFLQFLDLESANLVRANLSAADLRNAKLSRANLEDADLHGANFRDADLASADLGAVDLSEADLTTANLSHADLRGANLENAILDGVELAGATFDENTRLKDATFVGARHAPPALLARAREAGAKTD
jgi:uncharacterized protein YjbI with pentapeptide repeats